MNLLALDTSSDACSVALEADGVVISRHETEAREHTRLLLPMLRGVCEEAGLQYADLDAIVLGNGPGSFIGMRIAASVAQGLAFAAQRPIVAVSSLAAVAVSVFENENARYAAIAQDAHMKEVYFGLYSKDDRGMARPAGEERIAAPGPLDELRAISASDCIAAGIGWHLYPELADANAVSVTVSDRYAVPYATSILKLGKSAYLAGEAIPPEDVNPAYLRQKVASVPGR